MNYDNQFCADKHAASMKTFESALAAVHEFDNAAPELMKDWTAETHQEYNRVYDALSEARKAIQGK
jgi:hypothetical protein